MVAQKKPDPFVAETLDKVSGVKRNLPKVQRNSVPILQHKIARHYRVIALRYLTQKNLPEARKYFAEAHSWFQKKLQELEKMEPRLGVRVRYESQLDFARWNLWTALLEGDSALREAAMALGAILEEDPFIDDKSLPLMVKIVLREYPEARQLLAVLTRENEYVFRPQFCEWVTDWRGRLKYQVMKVGKPVKAFHVDPAKLEVYRALLRPNLRAFKKNLIACTQSHRSRDRKRDRDMWEPYMEGLLFLDLARREGLAVAERDIPPNLREHLPWIWGQSRLEGSS